MMLRHYKITLGSTIPSFSQSVGSIYIIFLQYWLSCLDTKSTLPQNLKSINECVRSYNKIKEEVYSGVWCLKKHAEITSNFYT